jgi:hypothetical protein
MICYEQISKWEISRAVSEESVDLCGSAHGDYPVTFRSNFASIQSIIMHSMMALAAIRIGE